MIGHFHVCIRKVNGPLKQWGPYSQNSTASGRSGHDPLPLLLICYCRHTVTTLGNYPSDPTVNPWELTTADRRVSFTSFTALRIWGSKPISSVPNPVSLPPWKRRQGRHDNKGGHLYQHIMISVILIPNKGKNHPISCKNIIIPSWLDNQWPSRFTTMKFIINFIIANVMFWILFLTFTTWHTYALLLPSHQHTIRFIHN